MKRNVKIIIVVLLITIYIIGGYFLANPLNMGRFEDAPFPLRWIIGTLITIVVSVFFRAAYIIIDTFIND